MMMKSFWPLKFFAAARMMNPLRGGMNAFRLVGQRAGEALHRHCIFILSQNGASVHV